MKKYGVVEYFESTETTLVEANSLEEARDIIFNDDDHNGEIIDVYEADEKGYAKTK